MKGSLYRSLALRNLKANRPIVLPYGLAAICIVAMYSMIAALSNNSFVQTRHDALSTMISFGVGVITIFALIFILYSAGFLSKHRQKENALYSMLGLSRAQLFRMIFWENVIIAVPSIFLGILVGALLGPCPLCCSIAYCALCFIWNT